MNHKKLISALLALTLLLSASVFGITGCGNFNVVPQPTESITESTEAVIQTEATEVTDAPTAPSLEATEAPEESSEATEAPTEAPTEAIVETVPVTAPPVEPETLPQETVPAPVQKEESKSWIGLVMIAGTLTFLLAGAMIFRSVSRKDRY